MMNTLADALTIAIGMTPTPRREIHRTERAIHTTKSAGWFKRLGESLKA